MIRDLEQTGVNIDEVTIKSIDSQELNFTVESISDLNMLVNYLDKEGYTFRIVPHPRKALVEGTGKLRIIMK
jgi:hypothetical protein